MSFYLPISRGIVVTQSNSQRRIAKTINLVKSQGFSFYDKNVKMPYVIQNRQYYGLKDFRLVMRI